MNFKDEGANGDIGFCKMKNDRFISGDVTENT